MEEIRQQGMKKGQKVEKRVISENLLMQLEWQIKKATKNSGLQNKEIAQRLGVSASLYTQMLTPKSWNIANLESIANALGCAVEIKFVPKTQKGEN
ncbi:MAG: hypothetical protein RR338_01160 [Clostridia bacterium]